MKKERQVSAFVSDTTHQRLDMFVRETGRRGSCGSLGARYRAAEHHGGPLPARPDGPPRAGGRPRCHRPRGQGAVQEAGEVARGARGRVGDGLSDHTRKTSALNPLPQKVCGATIR